MSDKSQLKIRLPKDVKEWLERQAKLNGSSQTSEVLRCIRERAERLSSAERA